MQTDDALAYTAHCSLPTTSYNAASWRIGE